MANRFKKKTHEQYCNEVKAKNENIIPNELYKGYKTKIFHRCKVCGCIWKASPKAMLRNCVCPRCSKKKQKINPKRKNKNKKIISNSTVARFNEKISLIYDGTIIPLEDYSGSNTKIFVKCLNCKREWLARPRELLKGFGCKDCQAHLSKGERRIGVYLKLHKITYETEKAFDWLTGLGGGSLRFDVFVPSNNLLIEFQGKQHYVSVKRYGGKKAFNERQIHDERKREFCKLHNIHELEISYVDFSNIEKILDNIFTPIKYLYKVSDDGTCRNS